MPLDLFLSIIYFVPISILIPYMYLYKLIGKKLDIVEYIILFSPMFNIMMVLFATPDYHEDIKEYLNDKNRAFTCKCGVTSRSYQASSDNHDYMECPHCNEILLFSGEVNSNHKYPFAPRMTLKSLVKNAKKLNELNSVKSKMAEVELFDREMESYQNLKMKQLNELEDKAREIKEELKNENAVTLTKSNILINQRFRSVK